MDSSELSKTLSFTAEQLKAAHLWSIEQWRQNISKLAPEQITLILPLASQEQDPASWKKKIRAAIDTLNTPQQLEAVGRTASFEQISEVLSWIAKNKDANQAKLFPFFVGMPQEVFLLLLMQASPEQQTLLKEESITEPIQHQLTLLTHSLSSISNSQNQTFNTLEMQLNSLDLTTIDPDQIIAQEKAIELLRETCLNTQLFSSKALALAWNSNRTDLIEKLSSIKEQSQKLSELAIGYPMISNSPPTGLYATLQNRLNVVFIDDNNKPLNDDEPALEALVKFSIWYISDYWEIGLLPHILDLSQLNQSSALEKERMEDRLYLFEEVKKNLKKINLFTLGDLKKHKIYSKVALKNYIREHLR